MQYLSPLVSLKWFPMKVRSVTYTFSMFMGEHIMFCLYLELFNPSIMGHWCTLRCVLPIRHKIQFSPKFRIHSHVMFSTWCLFTFTKYGIHPCLTELQKIPTVRWHKCSCDARFCFIVSNQSTIWNNILLVNLAYKTATWHFEQTQIRLSESRLSFNNYTIPPNCTRISSYSLLS